MTIYVQANYSQANNLANQTKNDVYGNGGLSPCLWLDFGADTDQVTIEDRGIGYSLQPCTLPIHYIRRTTLTKT
jgi:hypothetical protein